MLNTLKLQTGQGWCARSFKSASQGSMTIYSREVGRNNNLLIAATTACCRDAPIPNGSGNESGSVPCMIYTCPALAKSYLDQPREGIVPPATPGGNPKRGVYLFASEVPTKKPLFPGHTAIEVTAPISSHCLPATC